MSKVIEFVFDLQNSAEHMTTFVNDLVFSFFLL